jgi:hypothetical protein
VLWLPKLRFTSKVCNFLFAKFLRYRFYSVVQDFLEVIVPEVEAIKTKDDLDDARLDLEQFIKVERTPASAHDAFLISLTIFSLAEGPRTTQLPRDCKFGAKILSELC